MSWFGYTSLMLFAVGACFLCPGSSPGRQAFLTLPGGSMAVAGFVPWRAARMGRFHFSWAFTCWAAAADRRSRGLVQRVGHGARLERTIWRAGRASSSGKEKQVRFGKDPLYRKEFLWFIRDRSAIVQTILIPLSMAGLQVFNLRGLWLHAQGAWNYLCGVAIFLGLIFFGCWGRSRCNRRARRCGLRLPGREGWKAC